MLFPSCLIYCRKKLESIISTLMKPFLMFISCIALALCCFCFFTTRLVLIWRLSVVKGLHLECYPSWHPKALLQWPLVHPLPRQITRTSLSNGRSEAVKVKLVEWKCRTELKFLALTENCVRTSTTSNKLTQRDIFHYCDSTDRRCFQEGDFTFFSFGLVFFLD